MVCFWVIIQKNTLVAEMFIIIFFLTQNTHYSVKKIKVKKLGDLFGFPNFSYYLCSIKTIKNINYGNTRFNGRGFCKI